MVKESRKVSDDKQYKKKRNRGDKPTYIFRKKNNLYNETKNNHERSHNVMMCVYV